MKKSRKEIDNNSIGSSFNDFLNEEGICEKVEAGAMKKIIEPKKVTITVRLDTYVIEWLKSTGKDWQTRMNAILRKAMLLNSKKL